jgi:hypothetical protein
MKYTVIALLFLIAFTNGTRVAIINDLHLDPFYDPAAYTQEDCRGPNPFSLMGINDTEFAPYGRYGCDVPVNIINLFMGHLEEVAGTPDVILVSGDYTAHDVASKRGITDANYSMLKSIISQVFAQYINPMFPDSIIIPAIGNNDVKFHYEFPITEEESNEYYGFLYDLWWEQLETNRNYTKKEDVKKTLMNGGYFLYEHSDTLSFMAINSLYFSVKNQKYNSSVSYEQLDWVEDTLKNSEENRKFIINMHVFPGMYNPMERQQFWLDEFNNRFNEIMQKYGDKILMLNGAHTHISDVRASWMETNTTSVQSLLKGIKNERKAYYANFVSPSFSPFYLNNPGFTVFDVDDKNGRIFNITTHFLQLDKTYTQGEHELVYHSVDYEKDFGIKEWSPQEIMEFRDRAQNDDEFFKKFLVLKLGYRLDQEEAAMNVYKNLEMIDFSNHNKIYWCFFQYIRSDEYDACVAN